MLYIEEETPIPWPGSTVNPLMRTVIGEHGRLTRYQGQPFADLYSASDPLELENQFDAPGSDRLMRELSDALVEAMMTHVDHPRHPTAMA